MKLGKLISFLNDVPDSSLVHCVIGSRNYFFSDLYCNSKKPKKISLKCIDNDYLFEDEKELFAGDLKNICHHINDEILTNDIGEGILVEKDTEIVLFDYDGKEFYEIGCIGFDNGTNKVFVLAKGEVINIESPIHPFFIKVLR